MLNYSVVRRTREIGIRLAVGAPRSGVMKLVCADVGLNVLVGVAAGLAGGVYLSRFLRALLFEVEPVTFASLALPTFCLFLAAVVAAVPPARRAARVDPVTALRLE